jgi:hypothetical protein
MEASQLLHQSGDFELRIEREPPARAFLVARAGADLALASRRLHKLAQAHAALGDSPVVPAASYQDDIEGRPRVVFGSAVSSDFSHVLASMRAAGAHTTYSHAIAFIELFMNTLRAAHAAGQSFGALSLANLLVDDAGHLRLIGLGDNVLALDAAGLPLKLPDVFAAPDVFAGAAFSEGADLYAFTLLLRRLIPFVEFPPAAERVLRGQMTPEDFELGQLFAWCNLAILASYPDQRPSVADALRRERQAWKLMGVHPDRDGLREVLRRFARRSKPELVIDDDVTCAGPSSTRRKSLRTHRAPRRILSALIERHRRCPGRSVSVLELVEAGWPGESLIPDAAANRVYVALSNLRKLGLAELIERCDGGWRLLPSTAIRVADQPAAAGAPEKPRDGLPRA